MKYTFTVELDGRNPVLGGMRVQVNGRASMEQVSDEFAALSYWLGVNSAMLVKKVILNNDEECLKSNESEIEMEATVNSELFHEGFLSGMQNASAIDRNEAAPMVEQAFKPKED